MPSVSTASVSAPGASRPISTPLHTSLRRLSADEAFIASDPNRSSECFQTPIDDFNPPSYLQPSSKRPASGLTDSTKASSLRCLRSKHADTKQPAVATVIVCLEEETSNAAQVSPLQIPT